MKSIEKPACCKLVPLITFSLQIFCTYFLIDAHSLLESFLYRGCSQIKYTPGSQYESNLNSLLSSPVNSVTYPTRRSLLPYQCRADLAMSDCATCVARAVTHISPLCSQTCGGAVQLEGCFVKYDNASFIGVEDKTVVMKKCGPSDGYTAEEMSRHDVVLAGLNVAGGAYRVAGSEDVQGVAQCVGDLSMEQCQDCLMEAARRLKAECGGAVFGEV